MLDKQFYVYVHMRATDDSVFYVGKGCKYRYTTKQGRNQYWHRIVDKYGFIAEIVKNNLSFEEANAYEIELIKQLKDQGCTLCNLTNGGEGCLGIKKTDQQKATISAKNKGRKRTEETKAKMLGNKNALGTKHSDEIKAKMSASKKGWNGKIGYKTPEDVKEKIRRTIKQTLAAKKLANQVIDAASNQKDIENA